VATQKGISPWTLAAKAFAEGTVNLAVAGKDIAMTIYEQSGVAVLKWKEGRSQEGRSRRPGGQSDTFIGKS
jgi:hypothetical protein